VPQDIVYREEHTGITLTPHQQGALRRCIHILKTGNRLLITGKAGVGKTTLVRFLARHLLNNTKHNEKVAVIAPTNKAVSVIRDKMKMEDSDGNSVQMDFSTIHSALSYKKEVDEKTGKIVYVRSFVWEDDPATGEKKKKYRVPFHDTEAVIIDEASMISRVLLAEIYNETVFKKLIFVGDPAQIPPINEAETPVFGEFSQTPELIVELTEIVRQVSGNPIINLSRNLDRVGMRIPHLVNGLGYEYTKDYKKIVDMLARSSGERDGAKYIAYTNKIVDAVNNDVREFIYGEDPAKIVPNETLVLESVPKNSDGKYYINCELVVEDIEVKESYFRYNYGLKEDSNGETFFNRKRSPQFELKYYLINGELKVIHEDSEKDFKAVLEEIITEIEYAKKNHDSIEQPFLNSMYWWGYYEFLEIFAQIRYNHALTIHKSQGSTYKNVVVNLPSILFGRGTKGFKDRLLYTAITRASEKVIFLGG